MRIEHRLLLLGLFSIHLIISGQTDSTSLPASLGELDLFQTLESDNLNIDQWDIGSDNSISNKVQEQLDSISNTLGTDLFISSRIRKHINRYGIPVSPLEIDGMSFLTQAEKEIIMNLSPVDFVKLLRHKRSISRVNGKVWMRWSRRLSDIPQEYFRTSIEYPGSAFNGNANHILTRAKVRGSRKFDAAICLEKDAGEIWGQNGFDHWSGYLRIQPDQGRVEEVVVGSFQVQAAQGLTLWSGSKLQFQGTLADPMLFSRGISAYSGSMEMLQIKGIAARARHKFFRMDAFVSHQYLNGKVVNGNPESIDITGLVRTTNQAKRKSTIGMRLMGFYLRYSKKHQRFGVIYKRESLWAILKNNSQSLNSFGLEYLLNLPIGRLFGELSMKEKHSYAFLIGGLWKWKESSEIGFRFHHSPQEFYSITSPLLDHGRKNGIQEFVISMSTNLSEIRLFGSINFRKDNSGILLGQQNTNWQSTQVGVEWKINSNASILALVNNKLSLVERTSKTRWSSSFKWRPNSYLALKTTVVYHGETLMNEERGLLMQQGAKIRFFETLKLGIQLTSFKISQYEYRIYAYQNDVSQSLSIPAYQGNGYEANFTLQKVVGSTKLEARYTLRNSKSKSLRQDLRLQLILTF